MKNVTDLISSAKTVQARFAAAKMERETVREWVLGLGEYPEPHDTAIRKAKDWFRPIQSESEFPTLRSTDIERLIAIVEAGATQ